MKTYIIIIVIIPEVTIDKNYYYYSIYIKESLEVISKLVSAIENIEYFIKFLGFFASFQSLFEFSRKFY